MLAVGEHANKSVHTAGFAQLFERCETLVQETGKRWCAVGTGALVYGRRGRRNSTAA